MLGTVARRAARRAVAPPGRRLPQARNAGTSAGPEYNHFKVPHVDWRYKYMGEAIGCICWLWIFWRTKQDGAVVFGLVNPFEDDGHGHGDHGHGHDDHGHGHGHALTWTKEPGMKPELQSEH